jgi:transcriptional regulator with XRE-family HTH domain
MGGEKMLKIKQYREKAGLTQEQLAKKVGITSVYLCYLENGQKRNPSIPLLRKIAIELNVDIAQLLDSA